MKRLEDMDLLVAAVMRKMGLLEMGTKAFDAAVEPRKMPKVN